MKRITPLVVTALVATFVFIAWWFSWKDALISAIVFALVFTLAPSRKQKCPAPVK